MHLWSSARPVARSAPPSALRLNDLRNNSKFGENDSITSTPLHIIPHAAMRSVISLSLLSCALGAVMRAPIRKMPITRRGLSEGVLLQRGVLGALLREHAGYGGNGVVPISTLEDAQ